jgi:hypothetical protein
MALGFRRSAAVRDLQPGERVLAAAETATGDVIATTRRLILPGRELGWEQIHSAAWDPAAALLEVVEVAARSGSGSRHRVPIDAPGTLVDVVREQVTASVVIDRHVAIEGRRGVRVTARRAGDGDIRWTAALDPGISHDDPSMRPLIDEAVARIRSEVE